MTYHPEKTFKDDELVEDIKRYLESEYGGEILIHLPDGSIAPDEMTCKELREIWRGGEKK